ncbi:unnamed protein product [Adineta steineri]|uniref:Uncharacterized protein n=1 Tax=Adineta steineri TaxID=433720 RepID=A0A820F7W8_9BILA|nr:unnamed protein product [Adineta steineri]
MGKVTDIAPPLLYDITKKIQSPYRCSIDGRLSSVFKILFIILFVILIVLFIKSMIVSICYSFFTPTCCKSEGKKTKQNDLHITLLYVIFLLLNLFFSFPFYFVSMAQSILTRLSSTKDTFSMSLKICFLLRISSIILQCLAFSTIESNSWHLLSRLLYRSTCKKIPALNQGFVYTEKSKSTKKGSNEDVYHHSYNLGDVVTNDTEDEDVDGDNNVVRAIDKTVDEDDDDVFLPEPVIKPLNAKRSERKVKPSTDQDDTDEEKRITKRSTGTKNINNNSRQNRNKSEEEEERVPLKNKTTKSSINNSTSKQISNKKSISQPTPSTSNNIKTSKSNADRPIPKHQSVQRPSSLDDISNASVDSDDKIKPYSTISQAHAATDSYLNQEKRTTTKLTNEHRPPRQQYRKKHPQVSRPASTTSVSRSQRKTSKKRSTSPRTVRKHSTKSKHHRSKIHDNADEV